MTATVRPRIVLPAPKAQSLVELDTAVQAFAASAMLLRELDPVITEIVRLRCARVHDCRKCQSLRTDEAIAHGLTDETAAKIDQFEASDLDERTKVALRFTDAMITRPNQLSPELRMQVRANFTDAQVAELALDIMKWSYQKALVALRLEAPPRDGLSVLSFGVDGHAVIGDSLLGQ